MRASGVSLKIPRPNLLATLGLSAILFLAAMPAHADPLDAAAPCFLLTEGEICVRIVPTTVLLPIAAGKLEPAVSAVFSLERGNFTARTHIDYASQDILLVQANDGPAGSALNLTLGSLQTTYLPEKEVCLFRGCQPIVAWAPGLQKAGDVWRARLQIVQDGNVITDLPALTIILDAPAEVGQLPQVNEEVLPFTREYAGA